MFNVCTLDGVFREAYWWDKEGKVSEMRHLHLSHWLQAKGIKSTLSCSTPHIHERSIWFVLHQSMMKNDPHLDMMAIQEVSRCFNFIWTRGNRKLCLILVLVSQAFIQLNNPSDHPLLLSPSTITMTRSRSVWRGSSSLFQRNRNTNVPSSMTRVERVAREDAHVYHRDTSPNLRAQIHGLMEESHGEWN